MPHLSVAATATRASGIREVFTLARSQGAPVIELHVGEPSFPVPDHIATAACEAYAAGRTRYTANEGIGELRAAIAADVSARQGVPTAPDQVVVTAGGMQALHLTLAMVASPEDEVLIPDPGWPNFAMAITMVGAVPRGYRLPAAAGFRPDVAELESMITPATRAIIVNTPSNPLGAVLSGSDVAALVEFARRHDLWLISDECYERLVFGQGRHISPRSFDERADPRVVGVHTFSKTYAMTGVRVGYLVAPRDVAARAAAVQEAVVSCVNEPAQLAALAALTGPQDVVTRMTAAYEANRAAAGELLRSRGVPFLDPAGAFYLWVDVSALAGGHAPARHGGRRDERGVDVSAWARRMIVERGVAVAPGPAFGANGEGWVRVSLAADQGRLVEGLRRITAPVDGSVDVRSDRSREGRLPGDTDDAVGGRTPFPVGRGVAPHHFSCCGVAPHHFSCCGVAQHHFSCCGVAQHHS